MSLTAALTVARASTELDMYLHDECDVGDLTQGPIARSHVIGGHWARLLHVLAGILSEHSLSNLDDRDRQTDVPPHRSRPLQPPTPTAGPHTTPATSGASASFPISKSFDFAAFRSSQGHTLLVLSTLLEHFTQTSTLHDHLA